jgi:tRNA-modifying protein YgfZ
MAIDPTLYNRVREHVGLYDATGQYGRLFAKGKDALDLLHRMSTNDITPLETQTGKAVLTALTNEKGRIIDVLKVIRDGAGEVMLVTSKGKEQTVIEWLDKFTIMEDARFAIASDTIAQFLLCGPSATKIASQYTDKKLDNATRADVYDIQINNIPGTLTKGPSLAGNAWFIFTATERAETVRQKLHADILSAGGASIDDELFDLLRIENGTPITPNELNEKHNPLELPLANEVVSFTKGCYIGQEVIARLDAQGKVQRQLVGLRFGNGVPSIGDRIADETIRSDAPLGNEIGEITSIATSPIHGAIGLGFVRTKYANPGTVFSVKNNENSLPATLVKLPFD